MYGEAAIGYIKGPITPWLALASLVDGGGIVITRMVSDSNHMELIYGHQYLVENVGIDRGATSHTYLPFNHACEEMGSLNIVRQWSFPYYK